MAPSSEPPGPPAKEQQHRVVDAVTTDHEMKVVAIHLDRCQFGDAARDHVAVGIDNRVR